MICRVGSRHGPVVRTLCGVGDLVMFVANIIRSDAVYVCVLAPPVTELHSLLTQWSIQGWTYGNAVPIDNVLLERTVTVFLL